MDSEETCTVCEDKASGYHYGAFTCEGCKSFFKRTVHRGLVKKYSCSGTKDCTVDKTTRAKCQACRLQKCFDVGMVLNGVRKERKRGGRSFYTLKPESSDDSPHPEPSPESLPQIQEDKDEAMDTDKAGKSTLLRDLMASNPCIVPPGEPLKDLKESFKEGKKSLLMRLSNAITKELHIIVDWAKLMPGFGELLKKDQITLLTAAGLELIVFRVIFRSLPFPNYVYMNTTTCIQKEACYEILNKEIVDMIIEVVDRLRSVGLDAVEFACLMSILLADPESAGLAEKDKVEELRASFLSGLKEHMDIVYPKQPERFAKILLRLPALRDVCTKGYEYFVLVRANLEGEIPMSILLQEMFECARV